MTISKRNRHIKNLNKSEFFVVFVIVNNYGPIPDTFHCDICSKVQTEFNSSKIYET